MESPQTPRPILPFVALACLIAQNAVTFVLGETLSLMGFRGFPILLFLAGLPLLLLVHSSIVRMNREIKAGRRVQENNRLLAAVLILSGLLFFWIPVSDVGFRLLVGNRLQVCAIRWLETPEPALNLDSPEDRRGLLRERSPDCLHSYGIPQPRYVTRHGNSPADRYVALIYGGGFGHWGLMIGAPALQIDREPHGGGLRKMWPGFYAFDSP